MKKIRLGVNIDHVATVRNARGEIYPSPLRAALIAQRSGADSVTIHLREDRRHINELDLKQIKSNLKIPLNLEIAATQEMLRIALISKPSFICIVPEKKLIPKLPPAILTLLKPKYVALPEISNVLVVSLYAGVSAHVGNPLGY